MWASIMCVNSVTSVRDQLYLHGLRYVTDMWKSLMYVLWGMGYDMGLLSSSNHVHKLKGCGINSVHAL
jgi:hypothetical protein